MIIEKRYIDYFSEYFVPVVVTLAVYAGFFGYVFPKITEGIINSGYSIFPEFESKKIAEKKARDERAARQKVDELEEILTGMAALNLEVELGDLPEGDMKKYEELLTRLEFYQLEIK